jgi:hypothetical protein
MIGRPGSGAGVKGGGTVPATGTGSRGPTGSIRKVW